MNGGVHAKKLYEPRRHRAFQQDVFLPFTKTFTVTNNMTGRTTTTGPTAVLWMDYTSKIQPSLTQLNKSSATNSAC